MNVLKRIQNQPEITRKIILWSAVIILSLSLVVWWFKNTQRKLESFKTEEFKKGLNLPSFNEELKKMPEIEGLDISEEGLLKKIEGEVEKAKTEEIIY